MTKSLFTWAFVDSYSGCHFPSYVRFAVLTYLGIVFEGKADEPVMLRVTDDNVTTEAADHLWESHDARENRPEVLRPEHEGGGHRAGR